MKLESLFKPVPKLDKKVFKKAQFRQNNLTKPIGSLGQLERLQIKISGMRGTVNNSIRTKNILVFVADHGVTKHGVSAYPQEVTSQMLKVFEQERAAINVIAKTVGASLHVYDLGVKYPPTNLTNVVSRSIAAGTNDMSVSSAMTKEEVSNAVLTGAEITNSHIRNGLDVIAFGEMGIGNTTPASAITSVMCKLPPAEVTGPGSGLSKDKISEKIKIIEQAIKLNKPARENPLQVLQCVGGLEIAAIVGGMLASAHNNVPIVLDGFITGAAALIADALADGLREYLIAGHLSEEPGHLIQLNYLELEPLLRLSLRLGEGTGAALALSLVEAACELSLSMKTFDELGITRS